MHSSSCTTGVIDTSGKWKKSSNQKGFKYFVWTPLGSRVNLKKKISSVSGVSCLILFPLFATGVNDASRKFPTGVVDTSRKFSPSVVDTEGILPLVSLTPAANLLLVSGVKFAMVSRTPAYQWQIYRWCCSCWWQI
jgi:hypothetical protein